MNSLYLSIIFTHIEFVFFALLERVSFHFCLSEFSCITLSIEIEHRLNDLQFLMWNILGTIVIQKSERLSCLIKIKVSESVKSAGWCIFIEGFFFISLNIVCSISLLSGYSKQILNSMLAFIKGFLKAVNDMIFSFWS